MKSIYTRNVSRIGLALVAVALGGGQVFAQEAAETSPPDDGQAAVEAEPDASTAASGDGDIIVTGTRLRSGLTAPTPVMVSTSDSLANQDPGLIAKALTQLPVFKGSSTNQNSTQSGTRDNGASFLNLRGLGASRTLVLLDGRRFVPSSIKGVPDVNLFPQALVRRVEVVTGGASAAYGSDAVAGVVNFILDTEFEGLRANGSLGVSTYGDGASRNFSLAGGTSFAGGRGHVIASADYFSQDAIGFQTGRDNVESFAGVATIAPGVQSVVLNQGFSIPYGGRIQGLAAGSPLSPSVVNLEFLDGGLVRPYNFGLFPDGTRQVGGGAGPLPFNLTADVERFSGFLHAKYDVSDRLGVYLEGSVAQSTTVGAFQYPQVGILGYQFTIYSDNAFLRALPQATLNTLNLPAASAPATALFSLRRIPEDNGLTESETRSRTWRAVAGFDWEAFGDFRLSGYYMHGESRYRNLIKNDPIQLRRYAAVDAVIDPVSGSIVCRAALLGTMPGCVPFNPFGPNPGNAAANEWINGTSYQLLTLKEDVASLTIAGSLAQLPAGNLSVAIGAEYRREDANQVVDAITGTMITPADAALVRSFPAQLVNLPGGNFHYPNSQPLSGNYNVKEAFAEAELPILADKPFANLLSVNGAVRYIDYSTVGGVTTWKLGAIFEPVNGVRIRATRSRDIRAANVGELFTGAIQASAILVCPTSIPTCTGAQEAVQGIRSGNPKLEPEKADTTTAGLVLRPRGIPGLGFSVDYYKIKINGAIEQLTNAQTLNACVAGSQLACSQISRSDAGSLRILTPTLNLSRIKTDGFDFELSYQRSLDVGSIGVRALATYVRSFTQEVPGASPVQQVGDIGLYGLPKWSGSLQVTYEKGPFGLFLQERFIGNGKIDITKTDAQLLGNNISSVFYTDVSMHFDVQDTALGTMRLFGTVNNLFNKQPPLAPTAPFGNYRPTNASLYDVIGRYFTVGVKITI